MSDINASQHAQKPSQDEAREQREEEEVSEKRAASAYIVYRAISDEADEELERPVAGLAWSGLAAGLSMGFSLVAEGLLRHYLPDTHWRPLVAKWGYTIGFLIVVLGRQQLFTENTLTPVLPLLRERDAKTFWKLVRLWVIVFITNMIGTALFALVVAHTNIFDDSVKHQFVMMGREAIEPDFLTTILRGIFAGWLIALMVWLLPVAETGRIAVIMILTYLIGLGKMSHVVAGSIEVFYLAAADEASWFKALELFILPSLIGNVIGGTALVAALNYAQAAAGKEEH